MLTLALCCVPLCCFADSPLPSSQEHKSNIVRVHGYFYFRNHLCITFETLSINLYEFIKNNNFKGISLGLIRRFAIQLLQSLSFLKKERIIHCDLKPGQRRMQ